MIITKNMFLDLDPDPTSDRQARFPIISFLSEFDPQRTPILPPQLLGELWDGHWSRFEHLGVSVERVACDYIRRRLAHIDRVTRHFFMTNMAHKAALIAEAELLCRIPADRSLVMLSTGVPDDYYFLQYYYDLETGQKYE